MEPQADIRGDEELAVVPTSVKAEEPGNSNPAGGSVETQMLEKHKDEGNGEKSPRNACGNGNIESKEGRIPES